jgi:hypothetical protein
MPRKVFTALVALLPAILPHPALALSLGLSANGSASAGIGSNASSLGLGVDAGLDLTLPTGASASAISTTSTASTGTAAAGLGQAGNVGLVVDLIQSSDWTQTSFSGMGNLSANVVSVSDGGSADARATLDAALGVYATDIGELQLALAASPELSAWLSSGGIQLESIVAAAMAADGTLSVFTD